MNQLSNDKGLNSGDLLYCHRCLYDVCDSNQPYEEDQSMNATSNKEFTETDGGLIRMLRKLFVKSNVGAAKTSASNLDLNITGAGAYVTTVCVLCQKQCMGRIGDAATVFGVALTSKLTETTTLSSERAFIACSPMHSYTIQRPLGAGIGGVGGLAMLSCDKIETLHVARWGNVLEEYLTMRSIMHRTQRLKDLGVNIRGMAASSAHCCLFVSDATNELVHRVEVIEDRRSIVMNWPVGSGPNGLSINLSGNLLVTCNGSNTVQEFTPYGHPVNHLRFLSGISSPRHCVELPRRLEGDSRSFVVSHSSDGLCIINDRGQITCRYGDKGLSAGPLKEPRNIAVDSSGHILVADSGNNRVVVLDQSLVRARELLGRLCEPCSLCLDEAKGRLYVGEWSRPHVHVFSGVFNLASFL